MSEKRVQFLATAAMVDLIVFLSLPNETYHTALTFSLAKLYSNSLLVLFNNRSYMKTSEAIDISLSTASTGPRFRDTAPRASALPSNGIHVNVQQTTFISPEDIPLEERVCFYMFIGRSARLTLCFLAEYHKAT